MEDKNYILTKQEIGNAIVQYIGIFKEGRIFNPFRISWTDRDLNIPESVMFTLSFVPKGSTDDEVKHEI